MILAVPCTPGGVARWTQRTALDGRDYLLSFDWNARDGAWWLTLADENGDAIVSGRRVCADAPLLAGVIDARRPPGELIAVGARAGLPDPGFADLGTSYTLLYFDAAELGR